MIKAPEYIRKINPYIPGKPIEELQRERGVKNIIKLASNENPRGPSPKALEAIAGSLNTIHRYPDGYGYYLKNAISQKLNVEVNQIILGNGSNEIIEILVRTFVEPGREVIMGKPSFICYHDITQAVNGKSILVPLIDWRHDLIEMANRVTDKTKIIFIANPNNPTGTMNTKDEMSAFMEKVPDNIIVAVDEAYKEYIVDSNYPDGIDYLKMGRNIIVLRTFSKIHGLAGLRIGYAIAPSNIVEDMNRVRQPFNTNTIAQIAAVSAMDDEEFIAATRDLNEREKTFLYDKLKTLNIDFVPTAANFIFVPCKDPQNWYEKLLGFGIIVRPMSGGLRITIGLPEENIRLISALSIISKIL